MLWGTAAIVTRRFAEAGRAFNELERRDPADPLGPFGAWVSYGNLGMRADQDRARLRLDAMPESSAATRVQTHLEYYPELRPFVEIASRP